MTSREGSTHAGRVTRKILRPRTHSLWHKCVDLSREITHPLLILCYLLACATFSAMFSPPLRRSSPGLDLPSVFRLSSHDLDRSREDAQIASRPCLKRQATAPHPTVLTKKKRETSLLPDYTTLWSDEVHAAFLEGDQCLWLAYG